MSTHVGWVGSLTAVVQPSTDMHKLVGKVGHECFGFRRLAFPKCSQLLISTSSVSSSNNCGGSQVLPRLPVPPLNQTLEKYLKSVIPFLSKQEFENTSNLVKQFEAGIGKKLQVLLEKRAQNSENWLADWWLNSAYMDFRWPVVVHSNPGLVFPFQCFSNQDEQLHYAAKIVLGALNYKQLIDSDAIPLDKMGKDPLDMGQYKKVFGTCRLPGIKRDTLSFNNCNYIIVMHNGHSFYCPLWGEDNIMLSENQIVQQFKKIILASQKPEPYPIGIMTSEHRDAWGKVYDDMIKDIVNKESLKVIEKSMFVMCLDKASGGLDKERWERQTIAAGETIHGRGSKHNSGNRWFDKTIQFIVTQDGVNGLTYEHSPAEGQPIAVLTDHVIDFIKKNNNCENEGSSCVPNVKKLDFKLSLENREYIEKAKENIDKLVNELDLNCFTFQVYGKDFIKSQKMSPDSYLQMAMQFAFYRLHNVPGAHYESAATRKYIGGRTETIRSCSVESIDFARKMLNPNIPAKDKIQALHNAVKGHKDYSLQAVNGFGVDRHLLGLKLIAIQNGIEIPNIYSDSAFVKSTHMRISTSQVAAKCDGFMCYGPLVPDGYATCYNPRDGDINFATSAFKSNPVTDVGMYRKALEDSLMDMHNTLLQGTQSKL